MRNIRIRVLACIRDNNKLRLPVPAIIHDVTFSGGVSLARKIINYSVDNGSLRVFMPDSKFQTTTCHVGLY